MRGHQDQGRVHTQGDYEQYPPNIHPIDQHGIIQNASYGPGMAYPQNQYQQQEPSYMLQNNGYNNNNNNLGVPVGYNYQQQNIPNQRIPTERSFNENPPQNIYTPQVQYGQQQQLQQPPQQQYISQPSYHKY